MRKKQRIKQLEKANAKLIEIIEKQKIENYYSKEQSR